MSCTASTEHPSSIQLRANARSSSSPSSPRPMRRAARRGSAGAGWGERADAQVAWARAERGQKLVARVLTNAVMVVQGVGGETAESVRYGRGGVRISR